METEKIINTEEKEVVIKKEKKKKDKKDKKDKKKKDKKEKKEKEEEDEEVQAIDFSKVKKKKDKKKKDKSKKKKKDGGSEVDEEEEAVVMNKPQLNLDWVDPYSYEELLDRVNGILKKNNTYSCKLLEPLFGDCLPR